MRTDSAAILRSAFSGSIRLGTLEDFLAGLSADELDRLHYDFELWARDDQLPPERAGGGAPAMRFRKGTRIFHIVSAIDVEERMRWLTCLCEEREL